MRMRLNEEDESQKQGRIQKELRESGISEVTVSFSTVPDNLDIKIITKEEKIIKKGKK